MGGSQENTPASSTSASFKTGFKTGLEGLEDDRKVMWPAVSRIPEKLQLEIFKTPILHGLFKATKRN